MFLAYKMFNLVPNVFLLKMAAAATVPSDTFFSWVAFLICFFARITWTARNWLKEKHFNSSWRMMYGAAHLGKHLVGLVHILKLLHFTLATSRKWENEDQKFQWWTSQTIILIELLCWIVLYWLRFSLSFWKAWRISSSEYSSSLLDTPLFWRPRTFNEMLLLLLLISLSTFFFLLLFCRWRTFMAMSCDCTEPLVPPLENDFRNLAQIIFHLLLIVHVIRDNTVPGKRLLTGFWRRGLEHIDKPREFLLFCSGIGHLATYPARFALRNKEGQLVWELSKLSSQFLFSICGHLFPNFVTLNIQNVQLEVWKVKCFGKFRKFVV